MRTVLAILVAAGSFFMASCSTTQVGMQYTAPSTSSPIATGSTLSVGTFIDQRGEPETWLGAIRGGFGNPLKTLESDVPVSSLVAATFIEGLKARGVSATQSDPEFQLSGVVKKLFCNQVVQREANVEIEVQITDVVSKQVVFTRTYSATNYESAGLGTGVFGSVDGLRLLTERTLRQVVDQALDDSSMRLALRK